jgi:hypothetical protein
MRCFAKGWENVADDDDAITATALISQDLADALLASDAALERFRLELADRIVKDMDAWMESKFLFGDGGHHG